MSAVLEEVGVTAFAREFVDRLRELAGGQDSVLALHEPEFAGAERELVQDCLDTGWVSSGGRYVDRFETEIAHQCGASYGIAAVNGTAALQIALVLAGIQPGDEVIVRL